MADYEFATEEVIGTGRLTWQQINQANQHHEFILKVSQLPLTNFIRLLSLAVEHVGQLSILVRGHVTPLKGGMLVHKKRKDMAIYLAHIIYIEIPMLMGDVQGFGCGQVASIPQDFPASLDDSIRYSFMSGSGLQVQETVKAKASPVILSSARLRSSARSIIPPIIERSPCRMVLRSRTRCW